MKPLGNSGQCGRQCGVQFMVNKGHAIIGNMFPDGFSVVSCQDQRNPKPVACVPAPFNIWNIHLLGHEDLLMVINAKHMFAAEGLQVEARHYECTLGKKVGRAAKMHSK
ncbi:MAG: hypothetical protein OXF88_06115 [Rhodobacteraceae bacterium]|nr:hypothetical protein [Paracoccaceae bacterium]MCY4138802.1 hypothetical protein [Paracoccaceae bacterium]